MVWRKLGTTTSTPITTNSKANTVISLVLVLFFPLMFDVFSGGHGHRTRVGFVDGAAGKNDGGVGAIFWITGNGGGYGGQSNVGITIAVTVMAGLAVAAALVYSNRFTRKKGKMLTSQQKQHHHHYVLRALRRSHTSSSQSSSSSNSSSPTSSSSWRSVLLLVTSSSSSPISTTRDHLQSPWSRRRRKKALQPKQWRTLFDEDGRLCDGGVMFLKKVRSGGVHPNLRAEVWPFLLGVYDLKSSKEERDAGKIKNRKEYEMLRKQCEQTYKQSDKTVQIDEISESNNNSKDGGEVLDSSLLEDTATSGQNQANDYKPCEDGGDGSEITSKSDTESSDSDSSEEADDMHPSPTPEKLTEESKTSNPHRSESFASWQRIIRLDAIRANDEWIVYSPSQAAVCLTEAHSLAENVLLKDYDHLEACRIFHAARLVLILEAYALYDPEIGYCQGMSDLLSPIISVVEDNSEAFWCFVGFMKKARHNFRLDEVGIRRQLNIVSKIIKGKDSHLYRHLEEMQADDCFFVYRMVVVLFRRELNFEQTLCLWEVMWANQTAIRAGVTKSGWGKMSLRAPPTDDLLLYAIAACVLQRRKLIIEKYSSMDEMLRECNSMAGHLDVWKLLDDAHDLVVTLHDKI